MADAKVSSNDICFKKEDTKFRNLQTSELKIIKVVVSMSIREALSSNGTLGAETWLNLLNRPKNLEMK